MNRLQCKVIALAVALGGLLVEAALAGPASSGQEYSDYKIVTERNIFAKSRGPQSARQQPPPPPVESYMVLRGVVQRGTEFVAFVENVRTGETHIARVGEPLASGSIKAATLDGIELELPGGARSVRIGENLEGRTAAAPLPAELPDGALLPTAPAAQTVTTGAASGDEAAILERLRQRRQQEGGK